MYLRGYQSSDAEELASLFYDTVHRVNRKEYTQEQVDAWAAGQIDLDAWDRSLQEHITLVAVEQERLVGFGDIDYTGYLDRLFVHADHQGRGIATALCDVLEHSVPGPVTTHASLTAKPFFEARGYRVLAAQQVVRRGVELPNYVMRKESASPVRQAEKRFDRNLLPPADENGFLVRLVDQPQKQEEAAQWFHEKWDIPKEAYQESMADCLRGAGAVPQWYLALEGDRIVGGLGVIENDFHSRTDLAPNVCAVYTEEDQRGKGIAGALLRYACKDMQNRGIDTLYLLTDHTSFYERYGWEFFCLVQEEGRDMLTRIYRHQAAKAP